jgi:hypothetical protein
MKTIILKEDIFSTLKPKDQYGKKGEKVTVISDHGAAIIVMNSSGNKYSVNAEKTSYEKM